MLQWNEAHHSLGLEEMDVTHREFAVMAEALAKASDEAFPALFQELVDHTRQHFAEEGRLMHLSKFPPTAIHEGEHARVLGDLTQLNRHIQTGHLPLVRAFVESGLPEWFERHLATMDRALAMHLARTSNLAKPGSPQPQS